MESLTNIFDKYNSDKNSSFHNYCRQYEDIVQKYRNNPISFLEIGVFKGESIKTWREVFPNAKCIVGIDIDPLCKQYENVEKSIFIEIGDATDPHFLKYVNDKYGSFDVILDDGGHKNSQVIIAFEELFPLMKDNGLYIVEDTNVYKNKVWIDYNYHNHLIYFAKFIPYLNQWRFDSIEGIKDTCQDPFKIQKKAENVFEASIDLITFGCSFIAINKKIRHHWL
jgi:hypothetical protein